MFLIILCGFCLPLLILSIVIVLPLYLFHNPEDRFIIDDDTRPIDYLIATNYFSGQIHYYQRYLKNKDVCLLASENVSKYNNLSVSAQYALIVENNELEIVLNRPLNSKILIAKNYLSISGSEIKVDIINIPKAIINFSTKFASQYIKGNILIINDIEKLPEITNFLEQYTDKFLKAEFINRNQSNCDKMLLANDHYIASKYFGDIIAKQKLVLEQNVTIYGDIKVYGNLLLQKMAKIVGNVVVEGDIILEGENILIGNVFCKGNVSVNDISIFDNFGSMCNIVCKNFSFANSFFINGIIKTSMEDGIISFPKYIIP